MKFDGRAIVAVLLCFISAASAQIETIGITGCRTEIHIRHNARLQEPKSRRRGEEWCMVDHGKHGVLLAVVDCLFTL